ncbi:MAG: hypothetical protein Q9181_005741 [Wetmoreana brouardii]
MLPAPKEYANLGKRAPAPPIDPLGQTILCTPGTETYIKMTRKPPHDDLKYDKSLSDIQSQLESLIGNTWTYITREHLENGHNDSVISRTEEFSRAEGSTEQKPGWIFERTSSHGSFRLQVANAHHLVYVPRVHFGTTKVEGNEVTWGVLRAALTALGSHMLIDEAGWTECTFEIWDGFNQVGIARVVRLAGIHYRPVP